MKMTGITAAALILAGPAALTAQEILNSGFEEWTVVEYFEDPDGYTTTNTVTFFGGIEPNVTRSSEAVSGNSAMRLETIVTPDGVLEGAAFIGEPGEGTFTGGIPYDERPDSLTGFVKYDIDPTDTAYVAAVFKKFGVPIGVTLAQFTGVQASYQYFSVPVQWLVPIISPDTLAIALISSSIFAEPVAGNVLYVDNVQFVGPGDPFPNGDFEDWTTFSSEEPDHWQTTNILTMPGSGISVSKTGDSHSGSFAAKIESQQTNWNDTLAFVTNGTIWEGGPVGGMAVQDIPEMVSGYYKYAPTGPDSATVSIALYHFNQGTGSSVLIDKTSVRLPPAAGYTYFEVPVDYYSLPEPDTVNISFGSGNFEQAWGMPGLGSTLLVDDLSITFKPHIVSVAESRRRDGIRAYPNPAGDQLNLELPGGPRFPYDLMIYRTDGSLMEKVSASSDGKISVPVGHLPPGIYFYRLRTGAQTYTGKFARE